MLMFAETDEICKHAPKVPISPDVFDASLVPGTCLERFIDFKALINKFLESRVTGNLGTGTNFT